MKALATNPLTYVIAFGAVGAGLVIAGAALLAGAGWSLCIAGAFLLAAARFISKGMTPNG